MKKLICSMLSISLVSLLFIVSAGNKAHAQDVTVSYQTFYDELAPYGQWVQDPQYGNVWIPNEGSDFRPYGTNGYWVMTDFGNTWVSNDPWGWAVYHYGRWTYDPYYGWIWIPGYEWAPAWVSWRFGGGYCGWAPLGPGAFIGENYGCPDSWWVFLGPQYLYRHDHFNYWGDRGYNHRYINSTTIINNVYTDNDHHVQYNYGPREATIEQVTHQPVQIYHVSAAGRPGATTFQKNNINIYRPEVNRATVTTARPGNVIAAPMRIGKPQDAPANKNAGATGFREEEQKQNQGSPRTQPQNNNNTQPVHTNTNQYFNHQPTTQPAHTEQQPHFTPPAPQNRPEPPRNNPAPPQQHYNPPPQQEQHFNPPPQQAPRQQPSAPRGGGGGRR